VYVVAGPQARNDHLKGVERVCGGGVRNLETKPKIDFFARRRNQKCETENGFELQSPDMKQE
jgi:hypothetical protein